MKQHHKEHLSKFTKFCIVNGVTFACDVGMVRLALLLAIPVSIVSPISFISLSVVSYLLLHHWVFHDHTSAYSRATALFALLVLAQALALGVGMHLLEGTSLMPEIARTVFGVFLALFSYVVCHYVIFVKEK